MTRGTLVTDEQDYSEQVEKARTGKVTGTANGLHDWLEEVTGRKIDLASVYLTLAIGKHWQASDWWADNRDDYMEAAKGNKSNGHNRDTAPVSKPRGRPRKAEPEPEEAPAPRRRGRPAKAAEVIDTPAPAKRGRPRKAAPVEEDEPEPQAAPRRRGRPPKATAPEPEPEAAETRTAPRRGRPRKAAAEPEPAPASGRRGRPARKATTAVAPY